MNFQKVLIVKVTMRLRTGLLIILVAENYRNLGN